MQYKIERGIPIPPRNRGTRDPKYPFRDLRVGDSFYVPNKKVQDLSRVAQYWAHKDNTKFSFRSIDDGVRCWRIK